MLRAVLAVAVTVALLGVSMPVVESARVDVAQSEVRAELDRFERAAERLAAVNDPVGPNRQGARRVLTLRLPSASWDSAGLDTFAVAPSESTVRWAVAGGRVSTTRLAEGLVVGQPGGLELGSGRHRVVLKLTRRHGEPSVVVARPSFLSDEAATPGHAGPAASADG